VIAIELLIGHEWEIAPGRLDEAPCWGWSLEGDRKES